MELGTKIKDAITPSFERSQGAQENSRIVPEESVPGAFPGTEYAQEHNFDNFGEQNNSNRGASASDKVGVNPHDSKMEEPGKAGSNDNGDSLPVHAYIPGASTGIPETRSLDTVPIRSVSVSDGEGTGQSIPGLASEACDSEDTRDSARLQTRGTAADNTPQVFDERGTLAVQEPQQTTTGTKPRYLGSDGRALSTGAAPIEGKQVDHPATVAAHPGAVPSSTTGESAPPQTHPQSANVNEIAEVDSARDNLGQYSGPGSSGLDDPVWGAARQQLQDSNTRRGAPVEPHSGTHNSTHEDPSWEAAQSQVQGAQASSGAAVDSSGGIHNGISGAGSDDPKGVGSESLHKRQSQYRKGDIHSTIPNVSISGLGQGGIHNGVVGHGSHDKEASRHNTGNGGTGN